MERGIVMKICFLGDAASIHLKRWCEYFVSCGDEVSIISFRAASIPGVKIFFVGEGMNISADGGNSKYLKKILHIKKLLKVINPDIVNAHYLTSYGLLGALVKRNNLAISTWGSDVLVAPGRNIIYNKLAKYSLKKADIITSDSLYMTEAIIKLCSEAGKEILTVPMGINPKTFNNFDRNQVFNWKLLSTRTLIDNSNIDVIIRAIKIIKDEYDKVELIITNEGDKSDELKQLCSELKLQNNIRFIGKVDEKVIVELLKECSVYISIPKSDSTSVSLLEAMAAGIYPILSNIPANKEWIQDNENGSILSEISEETLAECIIQQTKSSNLFNNAMKINQEIIQKKALWENNMGFIRKKYIDLIK